MCQKGWGAPAPAPARVPAPSARGARGRGAQWELEALGRFRGVCPCPPARKEGHSYQLPKQTPKQSVGLDSDEPNTVSYKKKKFPAFVSPLLLQSEGKSRLLCSHWLSKRKKMIFKNLPTKHELLVLPPPKRKKGEKKKPNKTQRIPEIKKKEKHPKH